MIEADGSLRCLHRYTCKPPDLCCMIAPPEVRQHEILPSHANPFGVLANVGLNDYGFSNLPERGSLMEADRLFGQVGPHIQTSFITPNPIVDQKQFLIPSPFEAPSAQQKRYLIFDQNGSETRLIIGSLLPIETPTAAMRKPLCTDFLAQGNVVTAKQTCVDKSLLQEELGESSDIHEDTDEINALLYSDDEYGESDDEQNKDDEEISSGHSTSFVKENIEERVEDEFTEEVASSDVFTKRQKTLDGGETRLPFMDVEKALQSHGLNQSDNNAGLNCSLEEEMGPSVGSKRSRTDKIRDTLRIFQSIVPNSKGKDPVLVIDDAINYLKRVKFEAKALLMEELECFSSCGLLN